MTRFGVLTDAHYGDKPTAHGRDYRGAIAKMREAIDRFAKERLSLLVELGDLIDSAPDVATEIAWLRRIEAEVARFEGERHYVVGNHCVKALTKAELVEHTGAREPLHFSFERGGIRFVVLDACYRRDGVPYGRDNALWTESAIPPTQIEWLRATLEEGSEPVVVFVHQRLDGSGDYSITNAAEVRSALESCGRVAVVLQGHQHHNDCTDIRGVRYVTMRGMVEGSGPRHNGYAVVEVTADGAVSIRGFRDQRSYAWGPRQEGGKD